MKTWTRYKLSTPMCKRLARMVAGFPSGAGTTLAALERRGMVRKYNGVYPHRYVLTELGEKAMREARREGF